jgi:hypothetical protein
MPFAIINLGTPELIVLGCCALLPVVGIGIFLLVQRLNRPSRRPRDDDDDDFRPSRRPRDDDEDRGPPDSTGIRKGPL